MKVCGQSPLAITLVTTDAEVLVSRARLLHCFICFLAERSFLSAFWKVVDSEVGIASLSSFWLLFKAELYLLTVISLHRALAGRRLDLSSLFDRCLG